MLSLNNHPEQTLCMYKLFIQTPCLSNSRKINFLFIPIKFLRKVLEKQQILLFIKNIKKEYNSEEKTMNGRKRTKEIRDYAESINCTHAIFSDGDRQGSSNSSSLSSLFSPSSKPSSPEMLKDEDVNISGTGRIDGLRLPVILSIVEKQSNKMLID